MPMAGLISHMRWTEHMWLEVLFLGGDEKQNPSFDESSENADWHTDGRPRRAPRGVRGPVRPQPRDRRRGLPGRRRRHPDFRSGSANLRWMLIHLVEETGGTRGTRTSSGSCSTARRGYY